MNILCAFYVCDLLPSSGDCHCLFQCLVAWMELNWNHLETNLHYWPKYPIVVVFFAVLLLAVLVSYCTFLFFGRHNMELCWVMAYVIILMSWLLWIMQILVWVICVSFHCIYILEMLCYFKIVYLLYSSLLIQHMIQLEEINSVLKYKLFKCDVSLRTCKLVLLWVP